MDERARHLLSALVERYIADGQPVGSRTLAKSLGLELSPATIRNVMSDLEDMGLVASPHTSAGRIPTARGYRLFVNAMLTAKPPQSASAREEVAQIVSSSSTQLAVAEPQKLISNAASVLSNLSQFVGVVMAPQRASVFRHLEFVALGEKRVLLIMVTPDGDVQNRILDTPSSYSPSQLVEASNYFNLHFAGRSLDEIRTQLREELVHIQADIAALMNQAVEAGSNALGTPAQEQVVISGQHKLLNASVLNPDLNNLRRMFDVFEQKTQLLRLLDISTRAEGVQIYIGGESDAVPFEELSVITAPYEVNGTIVGTLGVIGPTRMSYERMIRIVDITAKLVGSALSQK